MSWHPSKIVYFSECYPQSVDIQISIPAISSTTTSVSELTIIRVWLPVKETYIMWTNIWVSASSDCIRLTYPYCKLQTIPSPFVTIICALVWASIVLILTFVVVDNMKELFQDIHIDSIMTFLRQINLFNKI